MDEIEFNEIQPKSKWIFFKENLTLWFGEHKKVVVIIAIVTLVLLLIVVGLLLANRAGKIGANGQNGTVEDPSKHEISAPKQTATPTPSEEAKTEVSSLDGVLVTKTQSQEMQKKRVLGKP